MIPASDGSPGPREYLGVLYLRKWVIVGVTAGVVAVALLLSSRETPMYTASAEVLVRPVSLAAASNRPDFVDIETERRIASSGDVAVAAREAVGALPLGGVSVSAVINARTLVFSASSTDPVIAQRSAQAFSEAYLERRREELLEDLEAASGPTRDSIMAIDAQIETVQRRILEADDATERTLLQVELTSMLSRKTFLEQRLDELVRPENLRVGRVIRPAALPGRPSSPNHKRTGMLALFAGLALGVGLAFVRERLDDRIRDRERLETRGGVPVLAVVPRTHLPQAEGNRLPVVTLTHPESEAAEAFMAMRTNLIFTAARRGMKSVMITSCSAGEGKTTTTANLGVALANAGKRVVLVSADLRRPSLHRYFGGTVSAGLTDLLSGERDWMEVLQGFGKNHPSLLGTGPLPGNPADLLGSEEMRQVIGRLGQTSDLLLLDAPAVLAVADAISLAPLVDGVLLVVDAGRTRLAAVAEAKYRLEQVGARIIGAVLNNFESTMPGRYEGYAGYATDVSEDHEHIDEPAVPGRGADGAPTRSEQRAVPGRITPYRAPRRMIRGPS